VRYRSRAIAGLLAFLTIPFGLHNFYLGYYGRGAISVGLVVLSFYLMAAGSIGFLFGVASATTPIFYLGIAMLLLAVGWQVSDMLRIGNGSLLPKNGAYRAKQPPIKPLN
jgi:TM2 domain-containing membrane protein YozV